MVVVEEIVDEVFTLVFPSPRRDESKRCIKVEKGKNGRVEISEKLSVLEVKVKV